MLEIKLLNTYVKKKWILFLLIFIYWIFLIAFGSAFKSSFFSWIPRKYFEINKNYDLIFIGIFIFPLLSKILYKNEFYKNYLLRSKKYFKSNLNILFYFLVISIIIILIKAILIYIIEFDFYKNYLKKPGDIYIKKDFSLSLFGDLHLAIGSLFIGKLIFFIPIKTKRLFYLFSSLIFIFILIFMLFFGPLSYVKITSTDVFSKQTINWINWIKAIIILTPLVGGFVLNDVSTLGFNFKEFLNFSATTQARKNSNIGIAFENFELNNVITIFILVSFFTYLILLVILSWVNLNKINNFKNKINTFLFNKDSKINFNKLIKK